MPTVPVYLTEKEYNKALDEARLRKIKVGTLLAQTVREAMPWVLLFVLK